MDVLLYAIKNFFIQIFLGKDIIVFGELQFNYGSDDHLENFYEIFEKTQIRLPFPPLLLDKKQSCQSQCSCKFFL